MKWQEMKTREPKDMIFQLWSRQNGKLVRQLILCSEMM